MMAPSSSAPDWRGVADVLPQALWLIDAATLQVLYANAAAAELAATAAKN